jgi:C4-dicarboxylate-specific signal transduction histidine kinase
MSVTMNLPRSVEPLASIWSLAQEVTGVGVMEFGVGPPAWSRWSAQLNQLLGRAVHQPALGCEEFVRQFVVADDQAAARAALAGTRGDAQTPPSVCRVRAADGTVHPIKVKSRWLTDSASPGAHGIAVLQEVGAVDAATLADQSLQEQLSRAARLVTVGDVVSGIAHEINQPLGAITTYAGALRRSIDSKPDAVQRAKDIAEAIAAQAMRAAEVISRVRRLSSHTAFEPRSTDVNETIREAMTLAQAVARARGVTLSLELATDVPKVRADAIQLQLLLLNLIHNAIEAIDSHQSVDRRVTIRSRRQSAHGVELIVEDTGGGIAPEIRDHLFHPFHTTKPHGVGLGLLSCQRIAQTHGSTLAVEKVDGVGARFSLVLPHREDTPEQIPG